jgi:hypothetical protein
MVGESDPSTIRWIGIHALYTGSLLDAFSPNQEVSYLHIDRTYNLSDAHTETNVLLNAKFSGSRSLILNMQGSSFSWLEPFLFGKCGLYPSLKVNSSEHEHGFGYDLPFLPYPVGSSTDFLGAY